MNANSFSHAENKRLWRHRTAVGNFAYNENPLSKKTHAVTTGEIVLLKFQAGKSSSQLKGQPCIDLYSLASEILTPAIDVNKRDHIPAIMCNHD